MNRVQLEKALERMDRLYPNVIRADYREEVISLGAAFPPLSRLCRQLAQLLQRHRSTKLEELLATEGDHIRDLHDGIREEAHRLLDAKVWPYD
ncbi:MAG TPA: hypothetical protein VED40_09690 [Azospirillaceae bacterium]|nr:hypothetical protein [Azospirillaceae bacterium]